MSFISVPGPHYIKRTLLFINSSERDEARSRDGYRFSFRLPQELQDVFSIELVQFNVLKTTIPTFYGTMDMSQAREDEGLVLGTSGSNMVTDVLIENMSGPETLSFTATLDPLSYFVSGVQRDLPLAGETLDKTQIILYFYLAFCYQWFQSTDAVLNSTNYDITLGGDLADGKFIIYLEDSGAPGTYASVSFLYGTGPNKRNQASQVLGFSKNRDTTPEATTFYGAASEFSVIPKPMVYIDVNSPQTREINPLARIYLLDEREDYVRPCDIEHGVRIIKNPVRRMQFLDLDVRLPGGIPVQNADDVGFQLTVEMYSVMPVPKKPQWVNQWFTL